MIGRAIQTGVVIILATVSALGSQEAQHKRTRVVLGAGPFASGVGTGTLVYVAGLEITPRSRSVSWRALAEYSQASSRQCIGGQCNNFALSDGDSWTSSRTLGLQGLATRFVGNRRVAPYFVAGLGIYWQRTFGYVSPPVSGSSFILGSPVPYRNTAWTPAMLAGVGLNMKVRRVDFFGEAQVPVVAPWLPRFNVGP